MEPNFFAATFNSFCVENNMLGVLEVSTCFQCIKQLHLTVYFRLPICLCQTIKYWKFKYFPSNDREKSTTLVMNGHLQGNTQCYVSVGIFVLILPTFPGPVWGIKTKIFFQKSNAPHMSRVPPWA